MADGDLSVVALMCCTEWEKVQYWDGRKNTVLLVSSPRVHLLVKHVLLRFLSYFLVVCAS